MNRTIGRIALAVTAGLALGSSALGADDDVYVSAEVALLGDAASPLGEVGAELWDLQEGLHAAITGLTGVSVPHYYVWICLNGACVPVDPFTVSR